MRYILIILIFLSFSCKDDDTEVNELQLVSVFSGPRELDLDALNEEMPVDRSFTLNFSLKIDPGTLGSGILLKSDGQEVAASRNLTSGGASVNLSAVGPLLNNQVYEISTTAALKSESGIPATPIIVRFETIAGKLQLISLEINGEPLNDGQRILNVPASFQAYFQFNTPVSKSEFDQALSISGVSFTSVAGNDNMEFQVSSAQQLSYLSRYTVNISENLKSESGGAFDGFSAEFFSQIDSTYKFPELTDEQLLSRVQEYTFRYFWDFAHPVSGLIRERNTSGDLVTIGGSGFGVMAILVGIERGFITREEGVARLARIVNFLEDADRFHGVWPHWMNGNTGATIPFSADDDGADLVETAFMIQGLLSARQYLSPAVPSELAIINDITALWETVEWDWFTRDGQNVLYWHWSPNFGWQKNLPIRGWNESLIVYVLAAASPTHSIDAEVYHNGWARNGNITNGNAYFNVTLPLGPERGGPLFFSHYSFLGLDPRNLEDQYASYWQQNVAHSRINQAYCAQNPLNYAGYGEAAWGLTASDNHEGYNAHSPSNDLGVITPTAAISSIPYTPDKSMDAIKYFYYLLGDKIWGEYGFNDAYNITRNWYADSYLAIDQGPIIIMIENYRTALLWELFMKDQEVKNGLEKLGFSY